jgi:hypothetical protein
MLAAGSIRNLGWFAAACFVAGWLLPAARDVPGWMAFRYAFAPVWTYGSSSASSIEDVAPQVLSALTNVAFIVLFGLLLFGRVKHPGLFFRVAIACFVLNLYWFVQTVRDGTLHELRIGYYVWLMAFVLMTLIGWIQMRSARISGV